MDSLESILSCVRNGAGICILSAGQQTASCCAISYLMHDCVHALSTACIKWSTGLMHAEHMGGNLRKLNLNSTGLITSRQTCCSVTARYLPTYLTNQITYHLSAFFSLTSKKTGKKKGKNTWTRKILRTQKLLKQGDNFEMFSMKILTFFPGSSWVHEKDLLCSGASYTIQVAAKGKHGWLFSLAGFLTGLFSLHLCIPIRTSHSANLSFQARPW